MHIKIKNIVIIFIIGCNLLINCPNIYAGIGAKPTITEIVVPQDTVTRGILKVANSDNNTLHVKVELEDWLKKRTGKEGVPVADWLTVTPMEFDIEPQGVREIEYAITPPYGHEGELVAMVFFAADTPKKGAFGIAARFGVSIYAAIENSIRSDADIVNISVKRNIQEKKDGTIADKGIIFVLEVENRGNVHLRPTGNILVTGEDGSEYNVEIGRGFPIYPKKRLSYAIRWDKKDLSYGEYTARITLDYGKLYDEDKKIERKISFLVQEDGEISF